MTSRDKLIQRIIAKNREIELAEVDKFLVKEDFTVRRTRHTYLYSKLGHRITFNAHNKVLHPEAVRELYKLLIDLDLIDPEQ